MTDKFGGHILRIPGHLGLIIKVDELGRAQQLLDDLVAVIDRTQGARLVHKDVGVQRFWLVDEEPPWRRKEARS